MHVQTLRGWESVSDTHLMLPTLFPGFDAVVDACVTNEYNALSNSATAISVTKEYIVSPDQRWL